MAAHRGSNGDRSSLRETDITCPNNGDAAESFDFRESYAGSNACTPFVSARSSPSHGPAGFFYSAPASPVRAMLPTGSSSSSSSMSYLPGDASFSHAFEFEFSARLESSSSGKSTSMSSADELFLNGKIRPMMPASHLPIPQALSPLPDADVEDVESMRGRDLRLRERSASRRTRSLSPIRSMPDLWLNQDESKEKSEFAEIGRKGGREYELTSSTTTPSMSASSSRSSSTGRNSRSWMFLKDFLFRNKSEGRASGAKFWSSITKEKTCSAAKLDTRCSMNLEKTKRDVGGKVVNGLGKRQGLSPSPHELHYTSNRAQAEELRRKTFLPYRQGLLGCLGFSSRTYGAINGFAKGLKPVSSR